MAKKLTAIFLVFGEKININNIRVLETKLIPNVGDEIVLREGTYLVRKRSIDYRQIERYSINDSGRGKEIVYIFV